MTTLDQVLGALKGRALSPAQLASLLEKPLETIELALQMLQVRNLVEEEPPHCPSDPNLVTTKSVCGGCSVKGFCQSSQDNPSVNHPKTPLYRIKPTDTGRYKSVL